MNNNIDNNDINLRTKKAVSVFKEVLDYEGFNLDVVQNGIMGTQYQFKCISLLTGLTEIHITPVSDKTPNNLVITGLKIDHIATSSRGIGIGAKLISLLSRICDIFDLDLCLWSEDNKRLKRWYRKLGFKESHTNSLGETLFILKKYNYDNVIDMLGKDKLLNASQISVSMSIVDKYFEEIFKD